MAAQDVDAVALVPGANLYYLTGVEMQASERVTLLLVLADGAAHLLAPALEMPRIESRARVPLELYAWSDAQGVAPAWASLRNRVDLSGRTVALDYYTVRILELDQLERFAPSLVRRDASDLLAELRVVKDEHEIAAMRRAARSLDQSLEALLREIRPGRTEREIAARWMALMREHGAHAIPDEPIVASGPNSAMPHTTASDRRVETGDLLILDGWCAVDGYYGDTTRTVAIGTLSDEQKNIYELTRAANAAGRSAVRPGRACEEVDRAARGVIERGGYGPNFVHRTGHGLGLQVHEPPDMVEGDTREMRPGMTFTVEPGIYVAGQGGVRIEDDIVVTQDGGESLTMFTRDLIVL
jgi:Xaa-Pro dipeptidase